MPTGSRRPEHRERGKGGEAQGDLSLLDIAPGERVRVRAISFDRVIQRCWKVGIEVGEVLQCLWHGAQGVAVRTESGRRCDLDKGFARYVLVERVGLGPVPVDGGPVDER